MRKELNKRVEIVGFARQAGRAETVAQAEAERAMLEAYLPAQLDAAALEAAVKAIAAELGTTQIGPVMAELRKRHAGQFDGKLASARSSSASHNSQRPVAPASVPAGARSAPVRVARSTRYGDPFEPPAGTEAGATAR